MKKLTLSLIWLTLFLGCTSSHNNRQAENEILQAEAAFNKMAAEEGIKEAFLAFAADSAVLNRNGRIIKGKPAIRSYFDSQTVKDITLQWEPEFVEIAASGDLGYTYGPFKFFGISAEGDTLRSTGVFHTVWKRQEDGSWKYVYD